MQLQWDSIMRTMYYADIPMSNNEFYNFKFLIDSLTHLPLIYFLKLCVVAKPTTLLWV